MFPSPEPQAYMNLGFDFDDDDEFILIARGHQHVQSSNRKRDRVRAWSTQILDEHSVLKGRARIDHEALHEALQVMLLDGQNEAAFRLACKRFASKACHSSRKQRSSARDADPPHDSLSAQTRPVRGYRARRTPTRQRVSAGHRNGAALAKAAPAGMAVPLPTAAVEEGRRFSQTSCLRSPACRLIRCARRPA